MKNLVDSKRMQEHADRRRAGVHRKPLRSYKEMCAELKVDPRIMRAYMSAYGAPTASINGKSNATRNSWYDPDAFRAWWKETLPKIQAKKD
jgi:hypothetical protein